MVQKNTEYMSDPARADRVIRRFMGMTLRELGKACGSEGICWLTDSLMIPTEGLSAEKTQDMTYMEFACLIERIGENPGYDKQEENRRSMRQISYRMVAEDLRRGSKTSIPIRLFMALPLKAFYARLVSYARRNRACPEIHPAEACALMKECRDCSEDYTIGDYISDKISAARKTWRLLESLEGYEKGIRDAHADLGILLIGSFHWAFPRSFHTSAILDKYRSPAVCREEEDCRKEGWEERQAG